MVVLDQKVLSAIGLFYKEMGFPLEVHPVGLAPFSDPQVERIMWLRVAGEPMSQEGRICLFDLCQTLERTPKEIWYAPLISSVSAARESVGVHPWSDLQETVSLYAKILATWRKMIGP